MAKPHDKINFHASPHADLHIKGLDPEAEPHVTKSKSGWNYLGSHDYIHNQYLKYAHPGKYHVYKVDTKGLEADDSKLAGEQQRYNHKFEPHRLTKVSEIDTTKNKSSSHPDAKAYLDWYNKISKPKG